MFVALPMVVPKGVDLRDVADSIDVVSTANSHFRVNWEALAGSEGWPLPEGEVGLRPQGFDDQISRECAPVGEFQDNSSVTLVGASRGHSGDVVHACLSKAVMHLL